jgi:hypothetical protein
MAWTGRLDSASISRPRIKMINLSRTSQKEQHAPKLPSAHQSNINQPPRSSHAHYFMFYDFIPIALGVFPVFASSSSSMIRRRGFRRQPSWSFLPGKKEKRKNSLTQRQKIFCGQSEVEERLSSG